MYAEFSYNTKLLFNDITFQLFKFCQTKKTESNIYMQNKNIRK